jgi:hypothetical protein
MILWKLIGLGEVLDRILSFVISGKVGRVFGHALSSEYRAK